MKKIRTLHTWILISSCLTPLFCLGQGHMTVGSGTYFRCNNNPYVSFQNTRMEVNGTWSGTNVVTFTGTSSTADSRISGNGFVSFSTLSVNKASGDLMLGRDIQIEDSLLLISGGLDVQSHEVDLLTTGGVRETSSNRIYGTTGSVLAQDRLVPQNVSLDIAKLGFTIRPTAAPITSIDVRRGFEAQAGAGNLGGRRYFDVDMSPAQGVNAEVSVSYFENELDSLNGGTSEASYDLWSSPDSGATWTRLWATANPSTNMISVTGLDSINRITISSTSTNSLPVEFLSLYAMTRPGPSVSVNWKTSLETPGIEYTVSRSMDLYVWDSLANISGQGSATSGASYEYVDMSPPQGTVFYRLNQIEPDGSFHYSPVLTAFVDGIATTHIYPIPANTELKLAFLDGVLPSSNQIGIYDLSGGKHECQQVSGLNPNEIVLDVSDLRPGFYILQYSRDAYQKTHKILVQH